jgi:hypothetical protein
MVFLIVGLLLGFLIGTRARQVLASLKVAGQAMRKTFSVKIPVVQAQVGTPVEDANDKPDEEEGNDDDDPIEIDDFMHAADADANLAEHPDVSLSPIMLYHVKKAKEELRVNKRRAALAAEGMTDLEIEDQIELETMTGGAGGDGKQNALAVLIAAGARVEPTVGGQDAEHVRLQDRKRMQRQVDVFLQRNQGIERLKSDDEAQGQAAAARAAARAASRDNQGVRQKTAHEVAKETEVARAGGQLYQRSVDSVRWAKDARQRYKAWRRSADGQAVMASIPRGGGKGGQSARKSAASAQSTERTIEDRRGGGAVLDMEMLASLQAEFQETGRGTLSRNTADMDAEAAEAEEEEEDEVSGAGVGVGADADAYDDDESYDSDYAA